MLCGGPNEKETPKKEDRCICIPDSLCSSVEHCVKSNFVKQLYSNTFFFFKDKVEEPRSVVEA